MMLVGNKFNQGSKFSGSLSPSRNGDRRSRRANHKDGRKGADYDYDYIRAYHHQQYPTGSSVIYRHQVKDPDDADEGDEFDADSLNNKMAADLVDFSSSSSSSNQQLKSSDYLDQVPTHFSSFFWHSLSLSFIILYIEISFFSA